MAAQLRAALIDVGGTLWPDGWHPAWDQGDPLREERLRAALPPSASGSVAEVLSQLKAGAADALAEVERGADTDQRTDEVIRAVLTDFRLEPEPSLVLDARRAMGAPVPPQGFLFPDAKRFLASVRGLRLRSVIVSNTFWRDSVDYRRDFEALGVSNLLDAIVTSVDAGVRKPHPAIFEAAVEEAGGEPASCVMIGNSEPMDVKPARALGMRVIRVAIEESLPELTEAHAVVSSLVDAEAILRGWLR